MMGSFPGNSMASVALSCPEIGPPSSSFCQARRSPMKGLSQDGTWTGVHAGWASIFLAPLALAFSSSAFPSGTDDSDLDRRIEALLRVFEDPEARGAKLDETRKAHEALVAIGKPAVGKLIDAYL